jgi:hypothetical protein
MNLIYRCSVLGWRAEECRHVATCRVHRRMSQLDRPVMLLNIFSVAPDHVISCVESVGTLCYLSRLVDGLHILYSGIFFFRPKKFKKKWESTKKMGIKHHHQNGVALPYRLWKPTLSQSPCQGPKLCQLRRLCDLQVTADLPRSLGTILSSGSALNRYRPCRQCSKRCQ